MKLHSLKEIQAAIKARREELEKEYGVAEIGIFGSYVRGEASTGSDVDILVSFNRPIGFFKFLELEEHLGECLGVKVEMVTRAALKPYIGRRILNEVVMLCEARLHDTGMRHKLIHEYFGVDLSILWEVVKVELPPVRPLIERLMSELTKET